MRSQNRLAPISFTLAVLVSQLVLMPLTSARPNPIDNGGERTAQLPEVPSTPPTPPDGSRQPGGSLSGDQVLCPQKPRKLTAITPANVHGKSLSEQPTLWFYMPYTSEEVQSGNFSILTQDEEVRIYETSFTLPDKQGFVSITVPTDVAASMEADKYYHWYLDVSCKSSDDAEADLNIDGWVQRVASASQNNLSPEIWYDMVNSLAMQLQGCSSPNKVDIRNTWSDLLSSIELGELSQEPVVGPVILTDS